jgi:hypothetical protein
MFKKVILITFFLGITSLLIIGAVNRSLAKNNAAGNQSLNDALKVGAAVEETDIRDLDKYLSETNNADLGNIFPTPRTGSYSRHNAFAGSHLSLNRETYAPNILLLHSSHSNVTNDT